ncbi:MAG: hypothetical protein PWP03_666 [Candidatus Woesearchaeota archaeon]|nr:hypothetical protein [Candidatus Woesearchaeota archaeon]MDN5328028.1 hypothetical protein [Candidatus Woesearchaeota archaeon]
MRNNQNFEREIYGKVSGLIRLKTLNIVVVFDGNNEIEIADVKQLSNKIDVGDFVRVVVVKDRNSERLRLLRIEKLHLDHNFVNKFEDLSKSFVAPVTQDNIVKSTAYEKLKPLFIKAINLINQAVIDRRPILIRHHFDTDGYSGAIAIEKAITSLALKINRDMQNNRNLLKRIPCTLPFYDLDEAVSDISSFLDSSLDKEPLLILIDNGSTSEDVLGLRKLAIYNFDVIVIDHHVPLINEDGSFEVDSLTKVHINPYKVGSDSNITAGMLGSEIAYMINPSLKDLDCLAALSGIADRSNAEELTSYLELAKSKGCDEEFLKKLAKVVDYLTTSIRRKESKTFIENLFDFKNKIQQKTVNLIYPELVELEKKRINTLFKFLEKSEKNNIVIAKFNFENLIKRGDYPSSGKSAGLVIDELKQKYDRVAVIAHGDDSMVVRTYGIDKDINDFIALEQKVKPYTEIEGGGHMHAASIRFIKAVRDEVMTDLEKWLVEND